MEMRTLCTKCDFMIISFVIDRGSPNFVTLMYIFWKLTCTTPRTVLPHAELCVPHGLALTKGRSTVGKRVSAALCSLSCLMNDFRFLEAASHETRLLIPVSDVTICRGERPDEHIAFIWRLVEALYGGTDTEFLWVRGTQEPTVLAQGWRS